VHAVTHACGQKIDLTDIKLKVSRKTQNCTIRSRNSAGEFVEHILLGCSILCPESAAKTLMTSVNLVQVGFAGSAVAPATYYDEGKYVGDFVDREFLLVALKDVPSVSTRTFACLFKWVWNSRLCFAICCCLFLPISVCCLLQHPGRFSEFPSDCVCTAQAESLTQVNSVALCLLCLVWFESCSSSILHLLLLFESIFAFAIFSSVLSVLGCRFSFFLLDFCLCACVCLQSASTIVGVG
jgi:hypothetical protein